VREKKREEESEIDTIHLLRKLRERETEREEERRERERERETSSV